MKKLMWRCSSTISGFSSCELETKADLEEALSHYKLRNYAVVVYNEDGIVDLEVHGDASLKEDVEADVKETIRLMTETKKEAKATYKRWRKKW